jgi:hypothetical protein
MIPDSNERNLTDAQVEADDQSQADEAQAEAQARS